MNFLLKGLSWNTGADEVTGDVRISKGLISEIGEDLVSTKGEPVISLADHFLYPGLINSHDHLEMNLYPTLGNPPYQNYVEWARDIYQYDKSLIKAIEKVDIKDRLLWGGLKNLISASCTVVHHNPWHQILSQKHFPVRVLKNIAWAHSLAFDKNIAKKFPRKHKTPFVIHAGEGIDAVAGAEIEKLNSINLLSDNTVVVHGVAIDKESEKFMRQRNSALVWCPASNFFMFHQTAPIEQLKKVLRIAIGSDSTMTGSVTLLDELRVAAETNFVTTREIFDMVTHLPAKIFGLPAPSILPQHPADLFITKKVRKNYFENLLQISPSKILLVMINGEIKLANPEIPNLPAGLKHRIQLQGVEKQVDIDVKKLKVNIERVAGRDSLSQNSLWSLIEA